MTPRATALAFDVYGTLGDPGTVAAALAPHVAEPARVARAWRAHQLEISWLLSLMERYEDFEAVTRYALETALADEELELTPEQQQDVLGAFRTLALYPEVPGALTALVEHGFRLAVLSNGSPEMLDAMLGNAGIRDRFGEVISVDEVGAYKPAPAVYRHAAERLGCSPGDLWLISANRWDAAGAKRAGLRVAKVERVREPSYPFADPPDVAVATLADLPTALAARR